MEEAKYQVKTDCIFYKRKSAEGEYCTALKELYCRKGNCGFCKSNKEYNADGTKK